MYLCVGVIWPFKKNNDDCILLKGVEGKYLLVKPLKDKFSARSFTIDKTLGNVHCSAYLGYVCMWSKLCCL